MNNTYCSKSNKCDKTHCPRHLGTFNGLYISLAEFDCEEVLGEKTDDRTNTANQDEQIQS